MYEMGEMAHLLSYDVYHLQPDVGRHSNRAPFRLYKLVWEYLPNFINYTC